MAWWVFPALVLCAVTFVAGVGVLLFLAARGVWRLFHPAGAHVAHIGPTGAGRGWVPWDTDPRFGSMQLAEDRRIMLPRLGASTGGSYDSDGRWIDHWHQDSPAAPREYDDVSELPPVELPPWMREAAAELTHEEDWRDQTRHDLAPAVLDQEVMPSGPEDGDALGRISSGPGGLAWPGPDQTWEGGALGPVASQPGIEVELVAEDASTQWRPVMTPVAAPLPPEPEPVRTVAGRLVETSGEWLRRLERDAGPGWTYAGTVAA